MIARLRGFLKFANSVGRRVAPALSVTLPSGSIAICLLIAAQASAQQTASLTPPESLKELTLEQLSQIEVTSVTKEAVPAFKTPAAISVLTSEQIHKSGARTIPDLLRLIPGVNVA
jgi:iron complex outermembrane receptor protein